MSPCSGSTGIAPLAGKGETFSLMESRSIWPGRGGLNPTKGQFKSAVFMSHAPSERVKNGYSLQPQKKPELGEAREAPFLQAGEIIAG